MPWQTFPEEHLPIRRQGCHATRTGAGIRSVFSLYPLKACQLAIHGDEGVGGHDAGSTRISDNGQVATLGDVPLGHQFRKVEDVADVEHPGDTGSLEDAS